MVGESRALLDHYWWQCYCGHHADFVRRQTDLVDHSADDPVDLAGDAVQDAGLHRLDGVLGDHRPWADDLDLAELGAAPAECLQGDVDTGGDSPSDVLTAFAHHIEGGRRAEVDDDRRPPDELRVGQGVDNTIGADLTGVVHQHRYAGPDARLHHHMGDVSQVGPQHLAPFVQDAGPGRAHRNATPRRSRG